MIFFRRFVPLVYVSFLITLCCAAPQVAVAATFNVMSFGAAGNGTTNDSVAIQNAVNAAISYSNANSHAAVEVYLPAGTYLLATSGINIDNSTNLTFTGASTTTTKLIYTQAQSGAVWCYTNTNLTVENFSADTNSLGFTQGTITGFNASTDQVTVAVESGYPLLSRNDLLTAYSKGNQQQTLWLFPNSKLPDNWGSSPTMTAEAATGSPSGSTGTITVQSIPSTLFVGERWEVWAPWSGVCFSWFSNTNLNVANIDLYGGGVNWGMNGSNNVGATYSNLYIGPPPYQPDRLQVCYQSVASYNNRGTNTWTGCNFSGSWDDSLDTQGGPDTIISQTTPNTNQIVVSGDVYEVNDQVKLFTQNPTTQYAATTITGATEQSNGDYLITLGENVTLKNPNSDWFDDQTNAGNLVLNNDMFTTQSRRVLLAMGLSTTVENCTFYNFNDLLALDLGPVPNNDTIENNKFINCNGGAIASDWAVGVGPASAGANVTITGNSFTNSGNVPNPNSGEPIQVDDITGVTISNNWFDTNWGANIALQSDANVTVSNNTFCHPNEIKPTNANTAPDDRSVVWAQNVATLALSGNLVSSDGPYTDQLAANGGNDTNVTGLTDGITQIDNPLAFYLTYNGFVMDDPSGSVDLDQATWTEGGSTEWTPDGQKWIATPAMTAPGHMTLADSASGQYVGTSGSTAVGADLSLENQAWTSGNPTAEQLWSLAYIDANDNNIVNDNTGDVANVIGNTKTAGTGLCQWYSGPGENQVWYTVVPPYAQIFPGFGDVTVTWAPTQFATTYSVSRSTTLGGTYTTLASGIATTAYVDSTATPGTTYYYCVTAAGYPIGYGESNRAAAVTGTSTAINLSSYYNAYGFYTEGSKFTNATSFDTYGNSFSATSLSSSAIWDGTTFAFGTANTKNAVLDVGQTITVPSGSYNGLSVLATGLDSIYGWANATVKMNYSDGTSATYTQTFGNWCLNQSTIISGQTTVISSTHRVTAGGTDDTTACFIYGYTFPVNPGKTLSSITLSDTDEFGIFSAALTNSGPVPVNINPNYNVTGIESDNWNYQGTGYDGYGYTYSSALLGSTINWDAALFNIGAPARLDAVSDAGQRIDLPSGNFSQMLIVGAYVGTNGSIAGTLNALLTYTDGNSTAISQGMTSWMESASQSGESDVLAMSYLDDSGGTVATPCFVHGYAIPVDSSQTTQWLDLPSSENFRILGIDLTPSAYTAPTFTMSVAPLGVDLPTGSSATATVALTAVNGFAGSASLIVTNLPTGVSATFAPASIAGGGISTLTISASSSAAPGTYDVDVEGMSGSEVESASLNLTVVESLPDTYIVLSPASATTTIGQSQQFTAVAFDQYFQYLIVQPTFTWAVSGGGSISSSGLFTPTAAGGPFTISATAGGTSGSAAETVVPFTLSASPSSLTVNVGSQETTSLSIAGGTGFSGTAVISATNVPAAITATVTPASISGSSTSVVTISVSSSCPTGEYSISLTAASGATGVTIKLPVDVVSGNVLATEGELEVGQYIASPSGTCFLIQEGNGDLALYDGSNPTNQGSLIWDSGVNDSVGSYVTVMQNDGNLVTYTGTTPGSASMAVWNTATYTGSGYTLSVVDSKAVMILDGGAIIWQRPTAAYSASLSPANVAVVPGYTASTTLSLNSVGNFTDSVSLTVSSLPAGVTASFSSSPIFGSQTSVLTFSASATALAGTYSVSLTCTDSNGAQIMPVTLIVEPSPTITSIIITPNSSTVATNGSQQFNAAANDQYGNLLTTQPAFEWSVNGGGAISPSGLFTAGTAAGAYTITAASGGISSTASVTVTAPTGLTSITAPAITVAAGSTATLTATLTATTGGVPLSGKIITFGVDGATIGTSVTNAVGIANYSTAIGAGNGVWSSQWYTPNFAGSGALINSTATAAITVTNIPATLTVASTTTTQGQTITLSATLMSTTGGFLMSNRTITFSLDGKTIGTGFTNSSGIGTITYIVPISTTAGNHTVSVAWAGDVHYLAATGTGSLTVAAPVPIATTIAASPVTVADGRPTTLTAMLASGTSPLSGMTVAFAVDGVVVGTAVTNALGAAACIVTIGNGNGSWAAQWYTASYDGSVSYARTSVTEAITLTNIPDTLTVSSLTGAPGQPVTLSATLMSAAGGFLMSNRTITFSIDGNIVGTGFTNSSGIGAMAYTIPNSISAGAHLITVTYAGDAHYLSASGTGTLTAS